MTGWMVVAVAAPLALAMSLFARRGRSDRARLVILDLYRRSEQPAVVRNLQIVMPVLAAGFIPLLAASAPSTLGIALPAIPDRLQKLLVLGSVSYMFLLFGAVAVLLYRPPRWLVPRWIVEDDRRVGYTPPKPGSLDLSVLGLGVLFLVIGVAVLGVLIAAEVL